MRRLKIRSSGELKRVAEKLRCGHVFHRQCILPWFMNVDNEASDNCPMCRQHIRFSNKVGMFNWRLFSRKVCLWNMAQLDREDVYNEDDYQEQNIDGDTDPDNEDPDNDELSSISSNDSGDDESDWFDADDWPDAIPPTYEMQFAFIKFIITQQKLTLTKLHGMRFNPLTNNICRNRHR